MTLDQPFLNAPGGGCRGPPKKRTSKLFRRYTTFPQVFIDFLDSVNNHIPVVWFGLFRFKLLWHCLDIQRQKTWRIIERDPCHIAAIPITAQFIACSLGRSQHYLPENSRRLIGCASDRFLVDLQ